MKKALLGIAAALVIGGLAAVGVKKYKEHKVETT